MTVCRQLVLIGLGLYVSFGGTTYLAILRFPDPSPFSNVRLVHKNHIIRTCLMYHEAGKSFNHSNGRTHS